jgi:hypothetical protein
MIAIIILQLQTEGLLIKRTNRSAGLLFLYALVFIIDNALQLQGNEIDSGKYRHFYDKSHLTIYNKKEYGENIRKVIVFFNLEFICYYINKCGKFNA